MRQGSGVAFTRWSTIRSASVSFTSPSPLTSPLPGRGEGPSPARKLWMAVTSATLNTPSPSASPGMMGAGKRNLRLSIVKRGVRVAVWEVGPPSAKRVMARTASMFTGTPLLPSVNSETGIVTVWKVGPSVFNATRSARYSSAGSPSLSSSRTFHARLFPALTRASNWRWVAAEKSRPVLLSGSVRT